MSQAYPHEFVAYDLSMTADTFNTAISPLVEAFLRDLRVFEDYLRVRIDADRNDDLHTTADMNPCGQTPRARTDPHRERVARASRLEQR